MKKGKLSKRKEFLAGGKKHGIQKKRTGEKPPQRESFGAGYPADVPGSFVRVSWVKNFHNVRTSMTRTRGRPRAEGVQKTSVRNRKTPVECPQMWVWPQVPLGGPSPTTSVSCLPHTSPGRPSRSIAKSARGVGEERDGGEGRALAGGRVLQLPWGWGVPSKRQLGSDPHLGALNPVLGNPGFRI